MEEWSKSCVKVAATEALEVNEKEAEQLKILEEFERKIEEPRFRPISQNALQRLGERGTPEHDLNGFEEYEGEEGYKEEENVEEDIEGDDPDYEEGREIDEDGDVEMDG